MDKNLDESALSVRFASRFESEFTAPHRAAEALTLNSVSRLVQVSIHWRASLDLEP
jgi:hypothetical protein